MASSPSYRPVVVGYDAAARAEMRRLLVADTNGSDPDMDEVASRLIDIVHGLGLAHDGSALSAAWYELTDVNPDHKGLAAAFDKAAEAVDPIAATMADDRLRARVNGAIRNRWSSRWRRLRKNFEPSFRMVDWDLLGEDERSEIREMLRHLARFERQFVRRGRVQKSSLDDALRSIAEDYLRWTGDDRRHLCALAYAPESRFIKFATLALKPAGQPFEVSPQALGRRWSRIVEAERAEMKELERDDDPNSEAPGD